MKSNAAKTAIAVVGAAAALAGGHRALLAKWRDNPDPLAGKPASFPEGETRFVETEDGARIHTVTAGHGPTVVLVHGITVAMAHWGLIAEKLLANGHQVIGIDQRGHGDSTMGTADYSGDMLGDDLADVFDELDIRDAVLAGHSMGGIAALAFATRHADLADERLRGLVLVSTTAHVERVRAEVGARAVPRRIPPQYRVAAGLSTFGADPSLNMIEQVIDMANATPYENRRAAGRGLRGFDVTDQLPNVSTETIVLAGTRDQVTPMSGNELIAESMPNARLVRLKSAGHTVIWERMSEVMDAIEHFTKAPSS